MLVDDRVVGMTVRNKILVYDRVVGLLAITC